MTLPIYLTPRMLLLMWLGLISGLPLALTAGTLTAWLTDNGINIKTIGVFALVGIPYAFKFVWAPAMDGLQLPWLGAVFGKRRSWMLLSVCLLAVTCIAISLFSPQHALGAIAVLTIGFAFFSASFDINVDAYRIEILPIEEQGAGAAMAVFGYRVGMLISGAGALSLASHIGWAEAYQAMALIIAFGIIPILLSRRPELGTNDITNHLSQLGVQEWITTYVIQPFRDFAKHQGWLLILLFIILFKVGDAFLGFMTNPFLIEAGYTKDQIAAIVKVAGFAATILGSFAGGYLVMRLGLFRSLMLGGILQAVANLPYAYLAMLQAPDLQVLSMTIAIDNFCGGLSTVAFVAYISSLCNLRFTATQYALLNSLASIGRTVVTAGSGIMVASLGWPLFFIATTIISVPSLVILNLYLGKTYQPPQP